MTTITLTKKEIKSIIKESIKEVLETEIMKLRALGVPEVSQKEQKEIEKLYKRPKRNKGAKYVLKI